MDFISARSRVQPMLRMLVVAWCSPGPEDMHGFKCGVFFGETFNYLEQHSLSNTSYSYFARMFASTYTRISNVFGFSGPVATLGATLRAAGDANHWNTMKDVKVMNTHCEQIKV
eukprot:TRINITY_DN77203_c0_g1_i1.p1 TRINITY_DN77203_c0_g1~~TRINITY_DN77203_c0_g1_i1.p1  ORF type:complete len:114 (+),score=11.85 TRINITY_DN77203_c0_g1_i1:146-487(+)